MVIADASRLVNIVKEAAGNVGCKVSRCDKHRDLGCETPH
jgi:hypothetical protein